MTEKKPVESIASSRTDETPPLMAEAQGEALAPRVAKPALTEKEIADVKAKARADVERMRKDAAKKSLLEQEIERLKMEEGLVSGAGGAADDMVSITVDLYEGAPSININGRPYWHGHTYTVPRHMADSMREVMFRNWDQERIRLGQDLKGFYAQGKRTAVSPVGIVNAPVAP